MKLSMRKKMGRNFCAAIAGCAILLGLSGCGGNTASTQEAAETGESTEAQGGTESPAQETETSLAEGADSDWYMEVLADPDVMNTHPYYCFADINQDGVPLLIVSSTESPFIGAEEDGLLYVYADGRAKKLMQVGGSGGEVFYCDEENHTLTYFYRYSGESHLELYHVEGGELEKITNVDIYEPHHYPEEDSAESVCLQDGEAISEEEADAFLEKYANERDALSYTLYEG